MTTSVKTTSTSKEKGQYDLTLTKGAGRKKKIVLTVLDYEVVEFMLRTHIYR